MAIMKKTWNQLITSVDAQDIFDDISQELESIDNYFNSNLVSFRSKDLKDLMLYVDRYLLKPSQLEGEVYINVWQDLPIYVSSFKFSDRRFILLLKNKLREYVGFYLKLVQDSGVSRNLSYKKDYLNSGEASSVERGSNSETPNYSALYDSTHPESDSLFDQAIADYASNINKTKASSTNRNAGSSLTEVTGSTWEEQKKNLELVFFNELKDFIASLPERIYSYYAVDTVPFTELTREYFKYLYSLKEIFLDE